MPDSDELDEIRQHKIEKLQEGASDSPSEIQGEVAETQSAPDDPIHITGPDHLEEVVADNDVVLVDFYADWCGPCQMLEPVVEQLAAETPAAIAKVDVDAHQSLAAEYGVQGVPMLLLFAEQTPVEQMVGVREKHHYEQLITQYADPA